ncbi:MATE family efflux transporter [Clostridium sulfidigenes]|uniref:MATE family efflux transporter n=1 Tax=Clostridium sulfidigenes TaxID=318464 RepID=UPI00068CA972|nr:MATE family efflux transporter [Clostridium sulfidigenes]
MEKRIDLTEGSISGKLVQLALPIMATSFIQMAYNLTDMLWVGRIGSTAVAAVGTAGFFSNLAAALTMIAKVGAEVKVSQSLGRKDEKATRNYIVSALQINIVLSLIMGIIILLFRSKFLAFFQLENVKVISMAETYLATIAMGMVITNLIPVLTAIFNGAGNSKTPFIINTVGLVVNIVFDPILIYGVGPIPKMGVLGAALATIGSQSIVVTCFLVSILKSKEKYLKFTLLKKPDVRAIKTICKLGIPSGVQSGLFTTFSILIARVIAGSGEVAIAVQKVGVQIEAITWMTAGGFSTALSSFVGQNYGAKKHDRIKEGYKATILIAGVVGILATLVLIIGGKGIFSVFIKEKEAIRLGTDYLRILGYSQLFMCIEITTVGMFNGLGRTYIPAAVSIILTGLRVPASMILSSPNLLGIDGVWWSISMSSVLKGITIVMILYYMTKKKNLLLDNTSEENISVEVI